MIELSSFAPTGFDGVIVRVEVDIRRGIPGLDIVGLPDAAIRESRERIRVAVRNSGFQFPRDRVLVNLAPGDVRKAGSICRLQSPSLVPQTEYLDSSKGYLFTRRSSWVNSTSPEPFTVCEAYFRRWLLALSEDSLDLAWIVNFT